MTNLIILNFRIVLTIVVPIILLMLQNTKYVFEYVDYFSDNGYYATGITSFQELIDTISYILGILSWIAAALAIFVELYTVFESVAVNHNQIISHTDAMTIFAACLNIISFKIIVASINFIGAFLWHQLHKSNASN